MAYEHTQKPEEAVILAFRLLDVPLQDIVADGVAKYANRRTLAEMTDALLATTPLGKRLIERFSSFASDAVLKAMANIPVAAIAVAFNFGEHVKDQLAQAKTSIIATHRSQGRLDALPDIVRDWILSDEPSIYFFVAGLMRMSSFLLSGSVIDTIHDIRRDLHLDGLRETYRFKVLNPLLG